jgi:hypothetical protein
VRISDLFEIEYGHSLSLNKLRQTSPDEGIAFVSRTARNNGVSAWVEPMANVVPLPPGLLTVCLRSRNYALATFVQPRPFYCGFHIYVLRPKRKMTLQEKLWWAKCIEANRYRYNFGRQANRSLAELEVPEDVPAWVYEADVPSFAGGVGTPLTQPLHTDLWQPFTLGGLFELVRGRNVLKRDMRAGRTAYVSASATNNGITGWIDLSADYSGGQITVCSNGSVGEAFYQPQPFIASGDVTILVPRFEMPPAVGLFICAVIYAEKYRWNYGRKWVTSRMRDSVIKLPVTGSGQPYWGFADKYMRALPLANALFAGDEQEPSFSPGRETDEVARDLAAEAPARD